MYTSVIFTLTLCYRVIQSIIRASDSHLHFDFSAKIILHTFTYECNIHIKTVLQSHTGIQDQILEVDVLFIVGWQIASR